MRNRRRTTLVALQRYTATPDEYGEGTPTWSPIGSEWVEIFWGRGDERRQAAMERGQQAATFQMDANSVTRGLLLRDRIVLNTENWDIVSISPDFPKRGDMELVAVRSQ